MTIVCLGEALIDLVPPSGESPRTTAALSIQPGGAPLNISIGLARLGASSLLLGCLSNDAFGRRIAAILAAEGVPHQPGRAVPNPTRLAVVDHLNGTSPFRFYGDSTADTVLSLQDVEATFENQVIDGLYVGSLLLTNQEARAVQYSALSLATSRHIPIYCDPNPRPSAWPSQAAMVEATEILLSHSTIAKLSLDDAIALGWPSTPEGLLEWCGQRFQAQMFITGGHHGSWTIHDQEVVHAKAMLVDALDPTGAGDASFAALIYQHQRSRVIGALELRFAAAAGALATQKPGAISGLPTSKEVYEMLERSS
jgi:fructokinase